MVNSVGEPNQPVLKPIEFQSMHQSVYEQIRDVLMKGGFSPGQKLSSRKLAAQFGTSDMPVRAALGRLLAEGALVQNNNGTFAVPLIGLRKFQEVMSLRILLEREATAQACGHIDQQGFATLRVCAEGLDRAIRTNAIDDYLDFNQRLKFTIYGYSTSLILQSTIRLMWLQAGPILRHLNKGLQMMDEANFHEEAIDALAAGERDRAADAIARDIQAGMAFLTQHGDFASD